jgi:hypothetical protein
MPLPKVASLPVTHEIGAAAIRQELASYLAGRGRSAPAAATPSRDAAASAAVAEFVCEEDVRHAIAQGRTILVGERTIITPSARDLGEARRVFVLAASLRRVCARLHGRVFPRPIRRVLWYRSGGLASMRTRP